MMGHRTHSPSCTRWRARSTLIRRRRHMQMSWGRGSPVSTAGSGKNRAPPGDGWPLDDRPGGPQAAMERLPVSASFGNDNHKHQPQPIPTVHPAALKEIKKDGEKDDGK